MSRRLHLAARLGVLTVAGVLLGAALAAHAVTPVFYEVCKGQTGQLRYSNREADGAFLVRCPNKPDGSLGAIEVEIKDCSGWLSGDSRGNVIVNCRQTGNRYPIVRGSYPR